MRRVAVISLILAVLVALVIITMPIGIERYAMGWLRTQGISKGAIDDVDFNPFTGRLRVELSDFSGESDQRGQVGLAELNFEWSGLFSSQVMLKGFALRDGQIDIQRLDDGRYSIGGLLLPPAPAVSTQEEETPGEVSWGFGITDVAIGRLSARTFDVLRREADNQSTLSIGSILLETIAIADRTSLNIEHIRLGVVLASIVRREDGQLALVSEVIDDFAVQTSHDAVPAGDTSEGAPVAIPASAEGTQVPFSFYIALLEIGENSRVAFQDLAVIPPFSTELELARVQLSEFGNADPRKPAKIALDLKQGDTATLSVAGDLRLFGAIVSDLKISLKDFDLTSVSSYSPGYHIQRGRLAVDAHAKLKDDTLDVSSALTLEKLKLSGKAGGEQGALGAGMAMPLDVALDLLRDSNDTITLKLPITGSVSDPQFGTGDIIRKAMQSALQKSAISYVKNALQPLGTIMFVASVAGKAARPRFDPVSFAAGVSGLLPEAMEYLEKIAKMLHDRPDLSITFCGVSTLADRDFLANAINGSVPDNAAPRVIQPADGPPPAFESERLELARARGNAVQDFFVAGHGMDAKRLFRCRSMLDAENPELPRVEIML